jgi:hypothetical protein
MKLLVTGFNIPPVYNFPERIDIIGPFVLIFQIIGMLPDINSKNREPSKGFRIHQRVVLVGGGADK